MCKRFSREKGFIIIILDIITVLFFLILALKKLLNDKEALASLVDFIKKVFSF